jgi:regulatory protein YycH of two-component signal transduction system YycFG
MIQKKKTEILIPEIQKLQDKNNESQAFNVNPEQKKAEFAVPVKVEAAPKPNGQVIKQTQDSI